MTWLKALLFDDPITIYVALGMIELVLLAVWGRYLTRRRLLVLAGPLLIAGAVFCIERIVVTDSEMIVAAVEEMAAGASADPSDLGPAETYLDEKMTADLGPWLGGTNLSKAQTLAAWRSRIKTYGVVTVKIHAPSVTVTGDRARARFATKIMVRSGSEEPRPAGTLFWVVDWVRREDAWRVISVEPPRRTPLAQPQ